MLVRRSVAQFRPLVTDREGGEGRGGKPNSIDDVNGDIRPIMENMLILLRFSWQKHIGNFTEVFRLLFVELMRTEQIYKSLVKVCNAHRNGY